MARRQLVGIGVTLAMLRSRVESGHLVPLHRGVYAVGHRRLRREGWWLAAVLAAGRGALLSHRDAAALHGLRAPGDHRRVEVVTPARAASTAAIHVRRTVLVPADATLRDGIPVTSVARTLVDLAGTEPLERLRKLLDEAERAGVLDVPAIEDALRRTARRHGGGHAAMRAVLAERRAIAAQLTRSALEDRFVALLDAHELPRALTNHVVHGVEVDAYWPRHALVVELDGYAFHSGKGAFQRDRERSNALLLAGLTVLRFTHGDVVRRPGNVAELVARALGRPAAP